MENPDDRSSVKVRAGSAALGGNSSHSGKLGDCSSQLYSAELYSAVTVHTELYSEKWLYSSELQSAKPCNEEQFRNV